MYLSCEIETLGWIRPVFIYRKKKLSPVMSGSEENKKFYAATPSGSIELGQFGEEVFEPGKTYFVDFSEEE